MADAPPEEPTPPVQVNPTTMVGANYHIKLWPEPPGPPTYLCLFPDCGYQDATQAEVLVHVPTVHGVDAVPTPLAADMSLVATMTQVAAETEQTPDVSPSTEEGLRA